MFQLLLRLALLFPLFCAGADTIQLSNDRLRLSFSSADGRLTELRDVATHHNFIGENSTADLWQLSFSLSPNEKRSLTPADAQSFRFKKTTEHSLQLIWENFQNTNAPHLKIEVDFTLEPSASMSRWRIAVHNLGKLQLQETVFPRLSHFAKQENEALAVPYWMGQVTSNPSELLNPDHKPHRLEWGYPGILSLQCAAFYQSNGPGIYLSCNDTNAFRKSFAFFGDGKGGAGFEMVHLPENDLERGSVSRSSERDTSSFEPSPDSKLLRVTDPRSSSQKYELPYEVVIGSFEGDWFTAAEIYRSWATNQWWAAQSRLAQNVNPSWVPKTALWVWNRGRSPGVLQPAMVLQKELGLPVSVMWHWWHGCSYDAGFPEYLPPREGNESFNNALAIARKHDINAIVYMNQRLWGMTTASWTNRNAEKFAVKGADGKVHREIYNSFTKQACASMCMHTPFWRDIYAGLAKEAFTLGVSGIYMDQACSSLACYDATHGHPIGGGKYWMNGFRLLADDIRQRSSKFQVSSFKSPIALAGEGVGESWLPYLDLMLSLQVSKERFMAPDSWEPIPFFQAVYHPFAIQYGNYSSLTMPPYDDLWPEEFAPKEPLKLLDQKFSTQFYREQARAFIWGQQPTIANFLPSHLKDRSEEIAFVLRLAKIRNRSLKYLLHGTFLRTPEINAPEATIDISRLSIYAGQKGGLTTFQKRVPLVLAAAWKATDGNVAIAVANCSNEEFSGTLKLHESYGLPRKGKVFQITEEGRKSLGRFKDDLDEMKISLPARGASVFEFVK